MTFKPAIWRPIAFVLSALNLAGVGFATAQAEPWHAALHAALALGFGLWAQRLRLGRSVGELPAELESFQAELQALQVDVGNLRQELSETQERLDFTERVLAQGAETRRVGPER